MVGTLALNLAIDSDLVNSKACWERFCEEKQAYPNNQFNSHMMTKAAPNRSGPHGLLDQVGR